MSDIRTIVYGLLLPDADQDWPGRNRLLEEMMPDYTVVLLEQTPGGRRALLNPIPRLEGHPPLLKIRNAFALSGRPRLAAIAPALALAEGRMVRCLLSRAGVDAYLIWLTTPGRGLTAGRGKNRFVYDCIDPSLSDDRDPMLDRVEERDARAASLVFATARVLFDRVRQWSDDVYLLPNATARADVKATFDAPSPVAGYVGTVDARFDAAAVAAAAEALWTWRFEIVGRVNEPRSEDFRRLASLPNVVVTGSVDEATARKHLKGFSVGLIPFTPRPMNDAINSIKMFDYLAAGLPVVTLDTVESRANPFVSVASPSSALAATLMSAYADDDGSKRLARTAWASEQTWAHRAEQALEILRRHDLIA